MELVEKLNWRYASKRMTGAKVPADKLDKILEAIRLSPSSMGLQPYTVIVIEDEALKRQLQPVAFNQPQITEASTLLVFAAWEDYNQTAIDSYIHTIATTRGVDLATLEAFKTGIEQKVKSTDAEALFNWNARQAYIALGFGIVAAATEGIDATPMEGFNAEAVDEVLGLTGMRSVSILSLGYRNVEQDKLVHAKKVRRAKEDLFKRM